MRFTFLLPLIFALPVPGSKHATYVDIVDSFADADKSHFVVQITREEGLFEDEELKATQTQIVWLSFDVMNEEMQLNEQPVEMGIANLQMEAESTISTVSGYQMDSALENVQVGIVDVQIEARGQSIEIDGLITRQIELVERITSINGDSLEDEETTQLVVQMFPDGEVKVIRQMKEFVYHYHLLRLLAILAVPIIGFHLIRFVRHKRTQKGTYESLPPYSEKQ